MGMGSILGRLIFFGNPTHTLPGF